ncbi:MAG: LPXTG cell wall anchor domain-containing protein [Eubacteriales bacterium]|nr:LPXTG cell wall anchor domain-containing protein [Eubacteriales bacterium]
MIMTLALFVQQLPTTALADAQRFLLSPEQLNAAVALTGLSEGAAGWHKGMTPSEHMNAAQVAGYLQELIGHDLDGLTATLQDVEVDLYLFEQNHPEDYRRLVSSNSLLQLGELSSEMRAMTDELTYHYDELVAHSHYIYANREKLYDAGYSEKERIQYSRRIEEAYDAIREIIPLVVQNHRLWEQEMVQWATVLCCGISDAPSISDDNDLSALVRQLDQLSETQVLDTILFRQDLGLSGGTSTRLSRLSAEEEDHHMRITVLSSDDFGARITGADGQLLEGVSITMTDTDHPENTVTSVTKDNGCATFAVKDFSADSDGYMNVSFTVAKEGYRSRSISNAIVKKGSVYSAVTMQEDSGAPYISSVTFNGKDAFTQELGVYYSPANDITHKIVVTVHTQQPCDVEMLYTSIDGQSVSGGKVEIKSAGVHQLLFESDWLRRFKPEENICFQIVAKDQTRESFFAQLKVQRGVVSAPLFDQSGAMTNPLSFGSLGFTLPISIPGLNAGAYVGLDLPYRYVPQFGMNLNGSTYLAIGTTIGNYFERENDYLWKTRDQQDLEARQRAVEKEGYLAKQLANAEAVWKGQESKKVEFLGGLNADAGFFLVLQGRYMQATQDSGTIKGQVLCGATVSFSAELTAQVSAFFVSANLSMSLAFSEIIGVELDANWNDSVWPTLENLRISYTDSGFSVNCRLGIGFAAGIGAKNIASLSVNGYGYMNFLFMLSPVDPYWRVSIGANAYLLCKLFLIKLQLNIWISGDHVIYDSRQHTSGAQQGYSSSAVPPELSEAFHGTAPNPDLKLAAAKLNTAPLRMSMPEMKYAELGGHVYGFYLSDDFRVTWLDLETGKSGTLESWYPDELLECKDYAFDIKPATGHKVSGLVVGILHTKQFTEQNVIGEDGQALAMQMPDPSFSYASMFFVQVKNGVPDAALGPSTFYHNVVRKVEGSFFQPQLEVDPYTDPSNVPCYGVVMAFDTDNDLEDVTFCMAHAFSILDGAPVSVHRPYTITFPSITDGRQRLLTLSGNAQHLIQDANFLSLYTLEGQPKGNSLTNEVQLMHIVGITKENTSHSAGVTGRYVLDSGIIPTVQVLCHEETTGSAQPTQVDDVFYLKAAEGENHQYKLCGARVEHRNVLDGTQQQGKYLTQVTLTDYDVTMPATRFHIQSIAGSTYLYWLETVVPEQIGDPGRYLLKGVTYDAGKNIVSEPFAIAEINPDKADDVPVYLYLSEKSAGYYITDSDAEGSGAISGMVYTFPFHLVTGLELVNAAMEYSMVTAGSYDEMLFTVRNTGNVAIAGYDIDVIQKSDGGTRTVQTLHVDCLDEANNRNTVVGSTESTALGLNRIDGFHDNNNGDEWYLKRRTTSYIGGGSDGDVSWAKASALMPGAVACYKTSLRVGADWHGDMDIILQVKKIYAVPNWTSTVSVDHGLGSSADPVVPAQAPQIVEVALEDDAVTVTYPVQATGSPLPVFSSNITFDHEKLDTAQEDLELDYRLYDQNGERMLEMTLTNRAARDMLSARPGSVTLRAYADGNAAAETFRYVFPQEIVHGKTYTLTLPVLWLMGDADPAELTVEVIGQNSAEAENMDNSFVIRLRQDPLVFLRHPADCTVPVGGTAEFTTEASGGSAPYSYRWQMRKGETDAWNDIGGATEAALILPGVPHEMNGTQVRCVVTDGSFNQLVSTTASLLVFSIPETGDSSQPLVWMTLAVLSLAAMVLLTRRRKA